MDVQALITDLQKHDDTVRIDRADFKQYVFKNVLPISLILIGSAVVSLFFFESVNLFLVLVIILLVGFYSYLIDRETAKQNAIFADRHAMMWKRRLRVSSLGLNGVIFGVGHSAKSYNSFINPNFPGFGVFNYRFKTGRGKHTRTHNYTVAYYDLSKELPHILLDSKKNDGLLHSSIPRFLDKKYRVSLEGDFDKHFSLYTAYPKPAEALTIISPDVMQTLIDNLPNVDIEIVDRKLWVYVPHKKDYKSYARALQAGLEVLKSSSSNIKHYKMDDMSMLAKQISQRSKLYNRSLTIGSVIIIFYLIYLLFGLFGSFSFNGY